MRITLDTNVANIVHKPTSRPQFMNGADAVAFRNAIALGELQVFVSEASVFLECLDLSGKIEYLSVVRTTNPRPQPDPRRLDAFADLASIGVKMLHAPLLGAEIFVDNMAWADDVLFDARERQNRFGEMAKRFPRHHPLEDYGNTLVASHPPAPVKHVEHPNGFSVEAPPKWGYAIWSSYTRGNASTKRAMSKTVRPLMSEWADALIVASHYAYGNDILLSTDTGKGAGSGSLMHPLNRQNLIASGIKIMSPSDFWRGLTLGTLQTS
ncbi:hypothetical protein ACC713_33985 [Rhizobium johnstonii]|uniref:hypothetical protein n=1 Tax=Rhizobium johnstonii TaxID=3019933 RepID=UPI003F9CA6BC